VLDRDHHIGAIPAQRFSVPADAGTANEKRVNLLCSGRVRSLARGAHRLERHLPKLATSGFRECEQRSHHSTLASV
jgi:hypothetical protein